jgi:hypothetical protein
MKTVNLMFDGEMQECLVTTADNGEIVCYAKDKRFVKFPADADLKTAVKEHNKANSEAPVSAEVVEARKTELDSWFKK